MKPITLGLVGLLMIWGTPARGATIYVDGSCGDDGWTGASSVCSGPNGPKATIQAAINASSDDDVILVQPGTYHENIKFYDNNGNGKGVTVKGINGHDETIIDASLGWPITNPNEPVVRFNCVSNQCGSNHGTLEGFTITGSTTSGVHIRGAEPTIRGSQITGCGSEITDTGGGIMVISSVNQRSAPIIEDSVISQNQAGVGGGIGIDWSNPDSEITIRRCRIEGNQAGAGGGIGSRSAGGSMHLSHSIIDNNSANSDGGGLHTVVAVTLAAKGNTGDCNIEDCEVWWTSFIENSLVVGNSAQRGGGVLLSQCTETEIINSTFSGNFASGSSSPLGGGTGGALFMSHNFCVNTAVNSIFYGNGSSTGHGMEVAMNFAGWLEMSHSLLAGGPSGVWYSEPFNGTGLVWNKGNITADPLFCNPGPNDCEPSSSDFRLALNSPAIDAGDNSAVAAPYDLDDETRIFNGTVDMGAYENQGTDCSDPAPCPCAPFVGDDVCDGGGSPGAPCSGAAGQCPAGVCGLKNRYITVTPCHEFDGPTSIKVTMLYSLQFPERVGEDWWAGPQMSLPGSLSVAGLECTSVPHSQIWTTGHLSLFGASIVPSSGYEVRQCTEDGIVCSLPWVVGTSKWGDVVAPFGGSSQPNMADVNAVVARFQGIGSAPDITRTDLRGPGSPGEPNVPNHIVTIADVSEVLAALQGGSYPFIVPACP